MRLCDLGGEKKKTDRDPHANGHGHMQVYAFMRDSDK
jgi:hypothetical protein